LKNINDRLSKSIFLYKPKIYNFIGLKKKINRLKVGKRSVTDYDFSTETKNKVLIQNKIEFEYCNFIVEEDSFDLLASNHDCKIRVIELFRLNLKKTY